MQKKHVKEITKILAENEIIEKTLSDLTINRDKIITIKYDNNKSLTMVLGIKKLKE